MLQNFGNRVAVFFPWGRGIGTLGFKFMGHYVDFTIMDRRLRMFTALERNGIYDKKSCLIVRSWYRLTLHGWQLMHREDAWGEWQNGRRRPPLYEQPQGGIPQRAWELREFFKPYQILDWYGTTMEVISFPSPEKNRVTVMMRKPNDPTTLEEVVLEDYLPDCGPVEKTK